MANEYATVEDLYARLPETAHPNLGAVESVLSAASRWIDGYCSRRFWLDLVATDRDFTACNLWLLDLGAHEIGNTAGVVVKTDDGSGTFATTLTAATYQLEPVNAPFEPTGAQPYTQIRLLSDSWPRSYHASDRQHLVRVTARFGWPEVPAPVREACLSIAIVALENPSGARAEAIDGYSVSYNVASSAEKSAAKDMLASFRRMWAA